MSRRVRVTLLLDRSAVISRIEFARVAQLKVVLAGLQSTLTGGPGALRLGLPGWQHLITMRGGVLLPSTPTLPSGHWEHSFTLDLIDRVLNAGHNNPCGPHYEGVCNEEENDSRRRYHRNYRFVRGYARNGQ